MSGLFGSLSIALSGLSVSQQELETSSNNVANANTTGYLRETVVTVPGAPVIYGPSASAPGWCLKRSKANATRSSKSS